MVEYLKIFTEAYSYMGVKEREEVHRDGDWHEVFHCWVIGQREDEWWIYLQQRSLKKKDYPGDFDITAAGHLEAQETVEDGVRELQEELGIDATFPQLESLGVIPYEIQTPHIHDAEFAHVFLYRHSGTVHDFSIQEEELDGLYVVTLHDFFRLIEEMQTPIRYEGFAQQNGQQTMRQGFLQRADLGALPEEYLVELHKRIRRHLNL